MIAKAKLIYFEKTIRQIEYKTHSGCNSFCKSMYICTKHFQLITESGFRFAKASNHPGQNGATARRFGK